MSASIGLQILISQAPDLAPNVVFLILFGLSSILYAIRSLKTRRLAYYYLFGFTILRTASYITRAIWSQNKTSTNDAIAGGVISAGGFFLAAQAEYVLFTVWLTSLFGGAENVPRREQGYLRLLKILLPLSSILGIVGSVKQFDPSSQSDYDLGTTLRKVSVLGFTGILTLLMVLTVFFAIRLRGNNNLQVASILCTGTLLLLIEMVYKLDSIWSQPTASVNTQKWVFYVFASVPEFIFSVFMGVFDLEKIFYETSGENEKGNESRNNV